MDLKPVFEQILEDAVAKAISRGGVIAKAAGVKLGEILKIDYNVITAAVTWAIVKRGDIPKWLI